MLNRITSLALLTALTLWTGSSLAQSTTGCIESEESCTNTPTNIPWLNMPEVQPPLQVGPVPERPQSTSRVRRTPETREARCKRRLQEEFENRYGATIDPGEERMALYYAERMNDCD